MIARLDRNEFPLLQQSPREVGSRSRSGDISASFNPLWQAIKAPLELDTFKGSSSLGRPQAN
jgi:hypothetical protein